MSGKGVHTPWESEECFPAKPAGQDYGYVEKGKLVGCTLEQLIDKCGGLESEVDLVWHPNAPRLVPVRTAGFLIEALRKHERATVEHNSKIAWINVVVFCIFCLGAHQHRGYFELAVLFAIFTGVVPLVQARRELRELDKPDWTPAIDANFERYTAWIETRSMVMTWIFLAIIGMVGGSQLLAKGDSIQRAGLVKAATLHGQWWRFFTGTLLHGNLIHFLFNASALWGLGRLTEALAGRFRFAFVFVLSMMGGSLFSLCLTKATSVGISGGLLGLIGFLIVLGMRRRQFLPQDFTRIFLMNVALLVVMGIIARSIIDNSAHMGGFVFGLLTGVFMVHREGTLPLPPSRAINIAGVISIAVVIFFAFLAANRM